MQGITYRKAMLWSRVAIVTSVIARSAAFGGTGTTTTSPSATSSIKLVNDRCAQSWSWSRMRLRRRPTGRKKVPLQPISLSVCRSNSRSDRCSNHFSDSFFGQFQRFSDTGPLSRTKSTCVVLWAGAKSLRRRPHACGLLGPGSGRAGQRHPRRSPSRCASPRRAPGFP
jgi:hypothetical protein